MNGFENEDAFVNILNGKRVQELHPLFQELIAGIFPNMLLSNDEKIIVWKNHLKQKADIFIKIQNQTRGISIKKGSRNSVHVEYIKDFISFLYDCGFDKDLVNKLLKYHYSDGTCNGRGKEKISVDEYKKEHANEIAEINRFISGNISLLSHMVDRCILKGTNAKYPISALVYGTPDDFLWIKAEDIRHIVIKKRFLESSGIHFGPLFYQPLTRCLNNNEKYKYGRFYVQIKWYSLFDDIMQNMAK